MRKLIYVFFLLLIPFFSYSQSVQKPNIIIILADDLGWGDVGYHGSEIMTPNIDRMAREGIILNQFYTPPICSPSRAGLMTGRYPVRFGLMNNVIPPWREFGVDTAEVFIPEMLAKGGYENRAAIGKWHLGHAYKRFLPLYRGFTHFYGFYNGALDYFTHQREGELDWHNDSAVCRDQGYATDLITDEAVKCIKAYSKETSPFFIYVAYNAPHTPLQAKKEDLLLYGFDENKPLISPLRGKYGEIGRGNTKRQTYAAMVTCMDRGIGKIRATLKKLHIDKNTIVLFYSDNGANPNGGGSHGILRGWKFDEWNGGVRSPAVIYWPKGFEQPGLTNQVMGYVDIMPTLLAAAGIKARPPKALDGINMLPALTGKKPSIDRYFYLGNGGIVHGEWKLIRREKSKRGMKLKEDELFNLSRDPSEKHNVREENKAQYDDLKEKVIPYDKITAPHKAPPYGVGRKGFVAPKNWVVRKY